MALGVFPCVFAKQALRVMYREQVHAARSMNKHADVLTRKTQEIDKSNEVREDNTSPDVCDVCLCLNDVYRPSYHPPHAPPPTPPVVLPRDAGLFHEMFIFVHFCTVFVV